jgi:DNA repair exonuclease SbcCD ATPase subunit
MTKLYPNCSETVETLGVKPSEIPYIKKRVKELGEDSYVLEKFTDSVGKLDGSVDGWINEGSAGTYDTIKDELLAKRGEACPFCGEKIKNLPNHLKEFHKEELKLAVGCIDEEEYKKIRKELTVERL